MISVYLLLDYLSPLSRFELHDCLLEVLDFLSYKLAQEEVGKA